MITRCKINIKKSVLFLDTNNKLSKGEIKKTIPLQKHKKNKIHRNKLTKEMEDLYTKNDKTDQIHK